MVRTLQVQDNNRKGCEEHPKKIHPMVKNTCNDAKQQKENKDHLQQKISTQILYKKLQPNTNSLRQTFVLYSRIHYIALNKFHTLFLAFHLYESIAADLTLKNIPQTYKTLCCMYIAMKYEEIYHIDLKELAKHLKVKFTSMDYAQYQLLILKAVSMNLDITSLDRTLETYLQEHKLSKTEEMLCYYFLELTFASSKIYKQFTQKEICLAILRIVKGSKGLVQDNQNTKKLIILLLQCRTQLRGMQRHICQKYESKLYGSVAHLPISLL